MSNAWSRVPTWAASVKGLTGYDYRVLLAICQFAGADGRAFPSLQTIAVVAAVNRNHVPRSIDALTRPGLIQREQRRKESGAKTSTIYRVIFDPPAVTADGDTHASPVTTDGDTLSPPMVTPVTADGDTPVTAGGAVRVTAGGALTAHLELPNEQPTGTAHSRAHRRSTADLFEPWWDVYPPGKRKVAKAKCAAKYHAIVRDKIATPAELLSGVKAYAVSRDVVEGYACQPYRWLNEQRWTVDHTAPEPKRRGGSTKPSMSETLFESADGEFDAE